MASNEFSDVQENKVRGYVRHWRLCIEKLRNVVTMSNLIYVTGGKINVIPVEKEVQDIL